MIFGLVSKHYLPRADLESPVCSASCSSVRPRATRRSFNRSCMVSFTCMAYPSFFLSLSVEIYPVLRSFPTSWIYGKERIFSAKLFL